MLVRVRDFDGAHAARFPEGSVGAEAFAAVAAAVEELSRHDASKMATREEGSARKKATREALERLLDAIGRTARAMAARTPGFDEPFKMPHRKRLADQQLLTAGRVFLEHAVAAKAEFVRHGLPGRFVEELRELVGSFDGAVRGRQAKRGDHSAAQAGIDAALAQGLDAVRMLDVVVGNIMKDDPVAMAKWARDRQVNPRQRLKAVTAVPPAPAVPPTPEADAPTAPTPPTASTPPPTPLVPGTAAGEQKPPVQADVDLKVAS
jgi:hypothetical protein